MNPIRLVGERQRQFAIQQINLLVCNDKKPWVVKVEREKKKRTPAQRRYHFACMNFISEQTGNCKDMLHEFFKEEFCPQLFGEIKKPDGEIVEVKLKKSTEQLSTIQQNEFNDKVNLFCIENFGFSVPLPTSPQIDQFMEQYK